METSSQCRTQQENKIRKELAAYYGVYEDTQKKSDDEKQGHRVDVNRIEKEIAGKKEAGFIFKRKIEEIDAEEEKEKHFHVRARSQEE